LLQHDRQRDSRALLEKHQRKSTGKPQRIHHELERDFVAADIVLFLYRIVGGGCLVALTVRLRAS
jgi:hypothetical protein